MSIVTINSNKNKKTLVFLHYFGGSAQSWNWVIDQLKNDYHCIAFDLPGFGESVPLSKPSLENFARYIQKEMVALGIKKYFIVGHSMGAKIALQIAANDSERNVQQLILIAPSPPGTEPIEEKEKLRMLKHPNILEAKKTINSITASTLSEEQRQLAIENNLITDSITWEWWLNKGMTTSVNVKDILLDLKITILNSQDDPVITPKIIQERVLNILVNANLITTENVGHLSPMENPTWVADQIVSIMSQ